MFLSHHRHAFILGIQWRSDTHSPEPPSCEMIHRIGNPMACLHGFFRTWRYFRREQVLLIHVNISNFWRPAELFAARLLGIPILAHLKLLARFMLPNKYI